MFKKLQGNKKGFTLIELIIVIAILGVLVTLAAPKFSGFIAESHVTSMKADVKVLEDAIAVHQANSDGTSEIPTTEAAIGTNNTGVTGLKALDSAVLGETIKNLKNDYSDYGVVVEGTDAGKVYHLTGVKGADKTPVYTIGN